MRGVLALISAVPRLPPCPGHPNIPSVFSVPLWPRLADKEYGHLDGPDSELVDAPDQPASRRRPPGAGRAVPLLSRAVAAHGRAPDGLPTADAPRCLGR